METVEINGRSDFALWAIQRAQEIVTVEGAAFAMAARDMNEEMLAETAAALGQAPDRGLRQPGVSAWWAAGCRTPEPVRGSQGRYRA